MTAGRPDITLTHTDPLTGVAHALIIELKRFQPAGEAEFERAAKLLKFWRYDYTRPPEVEPARDQVEGHDLDITVVEPAPALALALPVPTAIVPTKSARAWAVEAGRKSLTVGREWYGRLEKLSTRIKSAQGLWITLSSAVGWAVLAWDQLVAFVRRFFD